MDKFNEIGGIHGALYGMRLWQIVKFESLSILAILFALFFTNGYVYLETLNSRLGVPVARLGFDGQLYAVYGGVNFLVVFTAMLIASSGVLLFYSLMALFENPERKRLSSEGRFELFVKKLVGGAGRRLRNAREILAATLVVSFTALCFYGLWSFVVSDSIKRAERAAYREVKNCEVATISLKNTDSIKACIVGESDDLLYLIYKGGELEGKIGFEKGMLSKDSVEFVRSPSSINWPE